VAALEESRAMEKHLDAKESGRDRRPFRPLPGLGCCALALEKLASQKLAGHGAVAVASYPHCGLDRWLSYPAQVGDGIDRRVGGGKFNRNP
jgi:hypothetical protein